MAYFAMQYQIHFHDTMAYGSHHHMTNLKFQNIARETIIFETKVEGKSVWEEQLKDIVLLTREAYSLNLAPVNLGEKVAILLTYEDPTRSTVCLCFRVIRFDGQPVSCGYQKLICMHRETLELVPAPQLIAQYANPQNEISIMEKLINPSFMELLRTGTKGIRKIFTDEIISLGKYIANAPVKMAYPKIIDEFRNEYSMGEEENLSSSNKKVVFVFPGQGSYHHAILRELYTSYPEAAPYFHLANDIALRFLKHEFLPLITASSQEKHDQLLKACPDLTQIGIYLTDVLIARLLMQGGIKPDLVVGHSFGELAALATAGIYTFETGLKIVCQRILALESLHEAGKMAAVSCGADRAKEIIKTQGDNSIEISVINHPRQTVLSGKLSELDDMRNVMSRQGISLTLLKSGYPFHSSFLQGAVKPFRNSLNSYNFHPSKIPVYLCTERMLYSHGCDLAEILSLQFIRKLNFRGIVNTLHENGYRNFIECGAGDIVSKLILKNLTDKTGTTVLPTVHPKESVTKGLKNVFKLCSEKGIIDHSKKIRVQSLPDQYFMSPQLDNISGLVQDISLLLKNESSLGQQASISGLGALSQDSPDDRNVSLPGLKESVLQKETTASSFDTDKKSGIQPEKDRQEQKKFTPEKCPEMPIAIVSIGCVLPGAKDPEEYWNNIKKGISGIINLAEIDPRMERDFLSGSETNIISDKTYTLLNGTILNIPYDAGLLSSFYSEDEFNQLARGQKLLAIAITQSLTRLKSEINSNQEYKMQCILGATADGSNEYDEALFLESLQTFLGKLNEPANLRESFSRILEHLLGYKNGDSNELTQHKIYKDVIQRIFDRNIKTYVVDTACSSSLYSINLGIKSLRTFESDVILAGGVFAPGPANNILFAQFRGLTPMESRPLDASADGTIFGDGAGIVILKRLPDALSDGDHILAVIRGMGLSSDGKSPSINVPQMKGQSLAIRKAYETSHIDINTIQYIETHATATPVGDAAEFNALREVFQKRNPDLPPVDLGAVKALIGHTGWVSGMASVIKICKAFEERVIPRQYNYSSPKQEIDLDYFTISRTAYSWPVNIDSCPRRAGINGFGFGGTNAHIILEAFDEAYHRNLCNHLNVEIPRPATLAVVGIGSLFPSADKLESVMPSQQLQFQREALHLPAKKMLLPDVTDNMDASQYLMALAAEKIFLTMPDRWLELKNDIGVVLGMESKTERGVQANERIFLDRLRRIFSENGRHHTISQPDANRILNKLIENIKNNNMPSGPYTLPGLMPNVTASRIISLFDLKGPNIVVDMGRNSFFQSLFVAEQFLVHRDCKVVLAGGINAFSVYDETLAEAAVLLALTTLETAREEGLPILGTLKISELNEGDNNIQELPEISTTSNYKGAHGAHEILKAINQVRENYSSSYVKEQRTDSVLPKKLIFAPYTLATKTSSSVSRSQAASSGTYAYIQGTPIYHYTPFLSPADAEGSASSLENNNILFLTDQPDQWSALERSGALDVFQYTVVCPSDAHLKNSVSIDLNSDESIQNTIQALNQIPYDTIIAVKNLKDYTEKTLLLNNLKDKQTFLDLLFVICRHTYERIQNKEISVITLCLNAYNNQLLNPYTGLVSGFMKSLSRELPDSICKTINTDEENFYRAIRQVEIELGQSGDVVEVCYKDSKRNIFKLMSLQKLTKDNNPSLNSDSVVIATGGGRGVTAVLVEELLRRFGCKVIALGRTDTSSAPKEILNMDKTAFELYEPQFYKDELAKDKTKKITELKRQYLSYQSANELSQVIKRMQDLPGTFEYISVDINDESAINRVVESAHQKYGRLDLVLHGAGVQVSRVLTKKSLNDFRRIISTKLSSLGYLYRACEKYRKDNPVHFHILTSAFSYMGNDGQPDYGAANEAMNRITVAMSTLETGTHWSSMAWLGWAGIGMTRSSEFAALAASRKLRGVTKEEGQKIFSSLMNGMPTAPINILLADGEINYYKVAIESSPSISAVRSQLIKESKKNSHMVQWDISIENAPYLLDHRVNGIPTMPAAFLTGIIAETAQQLRPELKIIAFENANFYKFVRVYENKGIQIRVHAQVVSENERETAVQVRVLSDFIHKDGMILQKDIRHNETIVRMSAERISPPPKQFELNRMEAQLLPDPYVTEGSPVQLKGLFESMSNIIVGENYRSTDYKFAEFAYPDSRYQYMVPFIIMVDSLWRFGSIHTNHEHTMPVYVPERCDVMKVYSDFTDFYLDTPMRKLIFSGVNPREEGDVLHVGPVEARDPNGNIMLIVEGGVCRKFGELKNAF